MFFKDHFQQHFPPLIVLGLCSYSVKRNQLFFPSFSSYKSFIFCFFIISNVPLAFGLGQSIASSVWESCEMAAFCVFSLLQLMYLCIEDFKYFCFCVCIYVCICICNSYNSFMLVSSFLLLPAASKARPLFHQLVQNNHHGSVFL